MPHGAHSTGTAKPNPANPMQTLSLGLVQKYLEEVAVLPPGVSNDLFLFPHGSATVSRGAGRFWPQCAVEERVSKKGAPD